MACASPMTTIAEMRRYLERAGRPGCESSEILPFGVDAIDQHLPQGGLARGHLHEAIEGELPVSMPARTLFVAGILARMGRPSIVDLTEMCL